MTPRERPYLRLHREPEPLGSYLRPLERDYRHTAELVSAGFPVASGVVVDACHPKRSQDLRTAAMDSGLEVVLDPRSLDLSTEGGIARAGVIDLPWSAGRLEAASSFNPRRLDEYAEQLARTAVEMEVTAVLAPTHYLEDAVTPWLSIDLDLARRLRTRLDSASDGSRIRIYYPLASSFSALRTESFVARAVQGLSALALDRVIDAVWLRVNNFGTMSAGPLTVPRYISLARRLHAAGIPVVAERTGTVGLALLALGAVAGIESGITHGEHFSIRDLVTPRQRQKGGYAHRVYLPAIGAFLKRDEAAKLLNTRGMRGTFGCQERCCPRGVPDMLAEIRRHFVVTRASEVRRLAAVPPGMRIEHYLSTWLRFSADRATRAAPVVPALEKHRRRLDMWRATISDQVERDIAEPPTLSPSLRWEDHPGMDATGSS
jgi:hypothetical protein